MTPNHQPTRTRLRIRPAMLDCWQRLARKLRLYRQQQGWTVRETADHLGIPHPTYWRMEQGKREPTGSVLLICLLWLDLSPADLTNIRPGSEARAAILGGGASLGIATPPNRTENTP